MRMRYERRDPRPEDLRQIDELKSLTDSQEKDIFYLTEQLRALQMQHSQLQQQFTALQNSSSSSSSPVNHNQNQQSKKAKNRNTKNSNSSNSNNVRGQPNAAESVNNGGKNPQMNSHMPTSTNSQIQINVNNENEQQHQQPSRVKPPPLIKTVIYEEENENELCEEQLREERENAERLQQQQSSEEHGVMVELVPESPDYITKHQNGEEISEAQIITDTELLKNVPILAVTLPEKGQREIQVEVISTIEPANIQVVPRSSVETEF